MRLPQTQRCPYCNHEVEECNSEWEEGVHEVDCEGCGKEYAVSPEYTFDGFKIMKICEKCEFVGEECCCSEEGEFFEDDEEDEDELWMSWVCHACNHKWTDGPFVTYVNCPDCNHEYVEVE